MQSETTNSNYMNTNGLRSSISLRCDFSPVWMYSSRQSWLNLHMGTGRVRTLTTKVSEAEYGRIVKAAEAEHVNVSEYVRSRIFNADEPTESRYTSVSRAVLSGSIASRLLLMTAIYDLMRGQKWTHEDFARHAITSERQGNEIAAAEIGG